jgi:hypothetical protein
MRNNIFLTTMFERAYGFLRPVIQDVVEKYLDWGNPMAVEERGEYF